MSVADRSENPTFVLSCVVPVFNEGPVISQFLEAMQEQIASITSDYEIIVVDDGSTDDTVTLVENFCSDPRVKLIELSRNFGKETALTAGIDASSGDAVVLIDADFQHPIEMIPVFVDYWRQGYQMVYGVRQNRGGESFLKKKGAQFFYQIMHSSTGIDVPAHAGDFRLMDRVIVNALKSMPERNRFMKGIYAWVGYKTIGLPFQVRERLAGESGWGLAKLTGLALSGITAFTTLPLRIVGAIGLLISMISFFYAFYILSKTLILGTPLPGWPTVIVAITFIGGIQLLSLWVLGEYIAGIFNEVKQRPKYLVQRTLGFKKEQDTDAAD